MDKGEIVSEVRTDHESLNDAQQERSEVTRKASIEKLVEQEKQVDQYVQNGQKDLAVTLLYDLIISYAQVKNFSRAEDLREKLLQVDNMALSEIVNSSESSSSSKKERNAEIFKLRKEGKTLRHIGKIFGMSYQNVQRICAMIAKEELVKESDSFESKLSTRTKNGLTKIYGENQFDPKKIAKAGPIKLKLIDSIGPRSLNELANALHEDGHINNPKSWLTGK